jgi:hypothetical protein
LGCRGFLFLLVFKTVFAKPTYKNFINYVLSLSKVEDASAEYYKTIMKIINTSRKYYSEMIARRNASTNPTPPITQ